MKKYVFYVKTKSKQVVLSAHLANSSVDLCPSVSQSFVQLQGG